jgi:hypothetical protein
MMSFGAVLDISMAQEVYIVVGINDSNLCVSTLQLTVRSLL